MNELLALDFTLSSTLNICEDSRDIHCTRRLEWHEHYTLPSLWEFFQPSMISHGSYWHYWVTEQEVHWEENPLGNLKILYGIGAIKINENNEVVRFGGVKHTISNSVVYDAKKLLASAKEMVDEAKENFELLEPSIIAH